MSLPFFLVTTAAILTLVQSASVPNERAEIATESARNVETFDTVAVQSLPQQMPLTIQLPREEPPSAQFYPAQPVPYLRAPQYVPQAEPNYYEVPVPSEFLTAPTEGSWNPNDDPALYYELPASITKENVPTNQHPKKYNKDVHSKNKPLSTVPKQEIALEPISEAQYIQKQKDLYKTIEKLNKKENQRDIESEQVPTYIVKSTKKLQTDDNQRQDNTPRLTKVAKLEPRRVPDDDAKREPQQRYSAPAPKKENNYNDHVGDLKKVFHQAHAPKTVPGTTNNNNNYDSRYGNPIDSTGSDTTFSQNYDRKPARYETFSGEPQLTDSLASSTHHEKNGGDPERTLFHMVGHDGPMSYKWGYDTGKGHDRQFRVEERNKEGVVKGQFGYHDKEGKFRMMNYLAHPDHGFHMEPAEGSEVRE